MFRKIPILNGGEIAVHIIRACAGIRSVAIVTDAARFSLHVMK